MPEIKSVKGIFLNLQLLYSYKAITKKKERTGEKSNLVPNTTKKTP